QRAFDRILEGLPFLAVDLDELMTYLLEDANLQPKSSPRPSLKQILSSSPADVAAHTRMRLLTLSNLKNVNALADGQRLTFCSGLTIVYGANGSGKSGYARVLGSAGFTRG